MSYPLLRIRITLYPKEDKIKLILHRGSSAYEAAYAASPTFAEKPCSQHFPSPTLTGHIFPINIRITTNRVI